MQNCKEEFLNETKNLEVLCAEISSEITSYYADTDVETIKDVTIRLNVGFSDSNFETFLKTIDFNYQPESERGEYDGSEWWEYQAMPKIPKELL